MKISLEFSIYYVYSEIYVLKMDNFFCWISNNYLIWNLYSPKNYLWRSENLGNWLRRTWRREKLLLRDRFMQFIKWDECRFKQFVHVVGFFVRFSTLNSSLFLNFEWRSAFWHNIDILWLDGFYDYPLAQDTILCIFWNSRVLWFP